MRSGARYLYLPVILICIQWVLAPGLLQAQDPPGQNSGRLSVIPYPSQVSIGDGFLWINNGFRVYVQAPGDDFTVAANQRFIERLSTKTGIRFSAPVAPSAELAVLRLETRSPTPDRPGVREDESYSLTVTADGAVLSATNGYGVNHGLETLLQLVELRSIGAGVSALQIVDQPRFPWRGLLLDPVRHFLPVDVIKRQIDAMAVVKLNVLHFRFADDQAFRVESKRFPKLHELGGEGQYYSQREIREIVEYARMRGIRVVPEFCVPGHTAAWLVAYPEFGSRPGPYTLVRSFGIFEPTMDPTNEALYPFLDQFFGEMTELFPDPYMHIGGDEITGKHWLETPRIRKFMDARGMGGWPDLQAYFNKRLLPILARHGKRVIGWDEVLHPELPKSIVVQSWRGQKELAASIRAGYEGILSSGYYLDLMLPAESHYAVDPLLTGDDALTSEQATRVLGGEGSAWSEFITAQNIELKLWPRLAAVAERLWSPREIRDASFLYARFPGLLQELAWLDVNPAEVQRRMLRRAAGSSASFDDLKAVSEVLGPVQRYYRADSGDYTVFSPLNRLVDALWPESLVARDFRLQTEAAIRSPNLSNLSELRRRVDHWKRSAKALAPTMQDSALLKDAAPDMERLVRAADIALEAINHLESSHPIPPDWAVSARSAITEMGSEQKEIRNLLLDPASMLVEEVSRREAQPGARKDLKP